jgi:hypothetical protein
VIKLHCKSLVIWQQTREKRIKVKEGKRIIEKIRRHQISLKEEYIWTPLGVQREGDQ